MGIDGHEVMQELDRSTRLAKLELHKVSNKVQREQKREELRRKKKKIHAEIEHDYESFQQEYRKARLAQTLQEILTIDCSACGENKSMQKGMVNRYTPALRMLGWGSLYGGGLGAVFLGYLLYSLLLGGNAESLLPLLSGGFVVFTCMMVLTIMGGVLLSAQTVYICDNCGFTVHRVCVEDQKK